MRCPACAHLDDKVVDSRQSDDGDAIRRRRECLACGARFTTFERLELVPLMVLKRSGDRVPFEQAKITEGIAAAAKGRPIEEDVIEKSTTSRTCDSPASTKVSMTLQISSARSRCSQKQRNQSVTIRERNEATAHHLQRRRVRVEGSAQLVAVSRLKVALHFRQ